MAPTIQQAGKTFDPFRFKPQFMDGRDATNVKPDMGKEWIMNVKNELTAHINAGYAGTKANSVSGDDIGLVADSTTRVSAAAPGFHCISRHLGENFDDPEASYIDRTNYANPTKMDLYC